jgi:hypothetical protein
LKILGENKNTFDVILNFDDWHRFFSIEQRIGKNFANVCFGLKIMMKSLMFVLFDVRPIKNVKFIADRKIFSIEFFDEISHQIIWLVWFLISIRLYIRHGSSRKHVKSVEFFKFV